MRKAFSFGLYLVQDRHLLPVANDPAYLPTLMEIIARHKIRAILPGTEAEGRVLVAHVEPLAARGCVLISSPGEVVRLCADKGALSQWLMEHGYEVPLTVNAEQWHRLVSVTGFPIVGKPAKLSGGSRDVALLNDEAEVERYLAQRPQGVEVIVQQYVGSADGEYTVGVMVSKSGQIIDSIAMHRKLIGLSLGQSRRLQGGNFALSTGYSQGFIVKHALIQEKCEELALRLGVRRPANFQLRLVGKG